VRIPSGGRDLYVSILAVDAVRAVTAPWIEEPGVPDAA